MEWLESVLPREIHINYDSMSPLKQQDASTLRHMYGDIVDMISEHELQIRRAYTSYVVSYISVNALEGIVVNDMLNKRKMSNGTYKGMSDIIIICNSKTGGIRTISKQKLMAKASDSYKMHSTETSIVFDGLMRLALGWQNGNGMNNPTVRAFLLL